MQFDYNNMVSSFRDIDNSIINPYKDNFMGKNLPLDISSINATIEKAVKDYFGKNNPNKGTDDKGTDDFWGNFGQNFMNGFALDGFKTIGDLWSGYQDSKLQQKLLDQNQEQFELQKQAYYDNKAKQDEYFRNYIQNRVGHRL